MLGSADHAEPGGKESFHLPPDCGLGASFFQNAVIDGGRPLPLPRRGRRGPQRKTRKHLRAEGNSHPRFPPRGIAAAAYAKNVPLAHFLNAAAPGESAEGGYPTFCPFWSRPFSGKGPGAARVGPSPVGQIKKGVPLPRRPTGRMGRPVSAPYGKEIRAVFTGAGSAPAPGGSSPRPAPSSGASAGCGPRRAGAPAPTPRL